MPFDVERIRADFPILARPIRPGVKLVYLDSAATSQKPAAVLQAMEKYYRESNANIHRGIHVLAEEATGLYEGARATIARFVNAISPRQIIFTRNATEAINLVAQAWGGSKLAAGDLILLSEMEHHSNLVPWQMLAERARIRLEFIPVSSDGLLDVEALDGLLAQSPKLVALTHMSNVLGTINPVAEIIRSAHRAGALTLLDAAQSVPHLGVDVQALDVDFLAFSGHKMCGPTGIGVLYGKHELLEAMPPFLGGGDMIKEVKLRTFRANELPHKFEAGTPAIAEAVGLGAAVDYLEGLGMAGVAAHEHAITEYALERLQEVPGVTVFGPPAEQRGGVIAFSVEGIHPHDVAQILDRDGIAVRAGHHCAMPLHEKLGIPASTRASFYLYSTREEADALVSGIYAARRVFA